MNIFTFFEPVDGMDQDEQANLISLWRKNWSAQGWKCFVLNERHAKVHPWFQFYSNLVSEFPTVNPKRYEYFCFIRWLAFANSCHDGKCLFADYDVMSYGFTPDQRNDNRLVFYQGHVPALVFGGKESLYDLCRMFMAYQIQPDDLYEGRPHVSDMHIIQKLMSRYPDKFVLDEKMKNHGEEGWDSIPVVHYSHFGMPNMNPRSKFIPELRKPFFH